MKKYIKIQYLLCVTFAVAVSVLLYVALCFKVDDRTISNMQPEVLKDDWRVTFEDGSCHDLSFPKKITTEKKEKVLLDHELKAEMSGQTIAFHTMNKRVVVRIGNETIYTYANSDKMMFGQSPGSLWHFITIPFMNEDTVLEIELSSPYKNLGGEINQVLIGARSSCILSYIRSEWVGLFSGFALLLFGAVVILVFYAMGHLKLKNTGLFYLGLSSILMAVNMIITTGLLQIFYGNAVVYYLADYMSLNLCIIPLFLSLSDTVFEKKKRQVDRCTYFILILFFAAVILQVTNIMDFLHFKYILAGCMIVLMLYLVYLVIRQFQEKTADSSHILIILLVGLELACIVADYVTNDYGKVTYSQYGIMVILFILGSYNISKFISLYRIETDKEMEENILYTNKLVQEHEALTRKISLLQKQKDKAEDMNTAKSVFLANVAKELITPMNSIVGMAELISRDTINDSVKEKFSTIQTSGNSALTIINNIIDYSKFETGNMDLKYVAYHVESILYDMSELVSVALIEKNVEFIVDFAPYIPRELYGDEIRIRQILTNILTNAVKYTSNGVIRFRVDSSILNADEVVLKFVISDTGIGIKEEYKTKLFESFLKLDDSEGSEMEGTGLGLAICKRLLDMMGGSIKVESTYGEGTVFIIELPQKIINGMPLIEIKHWDWKTLIYETNQLQRMLLKKTCMDLSLDAEFVTTEDEFKRKLNSEVYRTLLICQKEYEKLKEYINLTSIGIRKVVLVDVANSIINYEHADLLQRPIQCMKLYDAVSGNEIIEPIAVESSENFIAPGTNVLIVDDNPANLKIVIGMLEPYKMNLYTAISGTDCLRLLEEGNHYDIIFMDYSMPEIDGVGTLHLIRKKSDKYYKTLPVIAMISHKVNGAKELFLQEGFDDYIAKPIEIIKLEKILENFLPADKLIWRDTIE